jgi:diguanylate cyclase (GGDEF)-like protein/PAS domain S-box-containing protein
MAFKLIAYCAGLAAALAIGLTAMGYMQAAQGLSERAEAALSSDALVVVTAVDDWNAQRLSSLQTVARLPSIARLLAAEPDPMFGEDRETAAESLAALDAPGEEVESAALTNAAGIVLLSTRPDEIGSDIHFDEDVRAALDDRQPTISSVRIGGPSNHPVIFHSGPVLDRSGHALGVVRSRSSVAAIERVVQSAEDRTGAGAMGTLIDADGLVLVDSMMPDWLLRPVVALNPRELERLSARQTWAHDAPPPAIGEVDLAHAIAVSRPILFDWRMHGVHFRALARPLSRTPWTYVAALPVATFDAPARDFLRNAVLAAAIGLLIGTVSVLLFAQSLASRLRRVTVAAQGLARGDIDQQIEVGSRDELGQMAAAFQDMIRHQQRMASVATTIAAGDLRSDIQPASEGDVLGHAFAGMLRNLRELVGQVSRSEERFRSLVQNASDATLILDPEWRITYVSPASERVWGHKAEMLEGASVLELVHKDDRAAAEGFLNDAAQLLGTNLTTELRLRHVEGSWREFEVIANNLTHQPAVAGIVLTSRDITERKAFERDLQHLAFHDALTGLPNRALLTDRLERALARADRQFRSVAVLFIDLDNFKLINDGLGHGAGDRLLVAFAERLKACIRAEDTAARLGGDEFVVLLEDVHDRQEATDLAERIADALRSAVSLGDREVMVSASIGVAVSTPRHDRTESVLRNADLALYRAKAAGKARWAVFEPNMEHEAVERLELETDLRKALGTSELRLVYQPIVSLVDGQILEVEALIRWQHPTRGPISPVKFIPIAEESGLIEAIGLWVLQQACHQAAQWQQHTSTGRPLVMSVNLSSRQFQDPRLVEQVRRVLDEAGLPPSALKLEITEGVLMQDVDATAARMRTLTDIGVRLAIDDFGTGYSSLSYLQRLPVETLKIDRSFVVGLGGSDPQAAAIVRGIVAMAKALRMSVTAEGIETAAQEAQLREIGCDRGQGYLFARPLPATELGRMLDPAAHAASDIAAA